MHLREDKRHGRRDNRQPVVGKRAADAKVDTEMRAAKAREAGKPARHLPLIGVIGLAVAGAKLPLLDVNHRGVDEHAGHRPDEHDRKRPVHQKDADKDKQAADVARVSRQTVKAAIDDAGAGAADRDGANGQAEEHHGESGEIEQMLQILAAENPLIRRRKRVGCKNEDRERALSVTQEKASKKRDDAVHLPLFARPPLPPEPNSIIRRNAASSNRNAASHSSSGPALALQSLLQPTHQKRQRQRHHQIEEGDDVIGLEE